MRSGLGSVWQMCEGMMTHQLIEAQKDQNGPNQRASQIPCRCSRPSLVHGQRELSAAEAWHGCKADLGQAVRWLVYTSWKGDPLDAPTHLGEPAQLGVNLD